MKTRRRASLVERGMPAADDTLSSLLEALRQINQALRVESRAVEQTMGISGAQLYVLQQLTLAPVTSLNELATRTVTRHSSVSVVVSRLEEAGLVVRAAAAEDARRTTIALTARGRSLIRHAPEAAQARLVAAARRLSRARREALASGLRALAAEMALPARSRANDASGRARSG